jgi:hypothetical protein
MPWRKKKLVLKRLGETGSFFGPPDDDHQQRPIRMAGLQVGAPSTKGTTKHSDVEEISGCGSHHLTRGGTILPPTDAITVQNQAEDSVFYFSSEPDEPIILQRNQRITCCIGGAKDTNESRDCSIGDHRHFPFPMYTGVASGSQRLVRYPSFLTLSVTGIIVALLFSMASLELSTVATDQRNQISRWLANKGPSLLTSYWLFSPLGMLLQKDKEKEKHYDWNISTEDNFRSDNQEFHGTFRSTRRRLDHSYHANYSPNRQEIQDSIIESMLFPTKVKDFDTGTECSVPTEPWIVFTAGVYGVFKVLCMEHY